MSAKLCQSDASLSLPVLNGGERGGLIRRSKNGPRRAAVLLGLHALFAAHLAHWWSTGRTLSPIEPSESMRTLELGEVNAGAIFFAAAIVFTLVFGRFVCGWGCHIVALQDLCGWLMKKCGVRPKPFRSRLLVYVPLVLALYMFAWPTAKRVVVAPVLERWWPTVRADLGVTPFPDVGFTNHLMTEGFWDTFASVGVAIPFLLVCGFATVYFLGAKGFCTYGCPYGGLFGPADLVSVGKIVMDPAKCHQCGHCTAVCTSNVRVHEEIRAYGMVVDPGCMKCMDCVSVCPNGALSFGFRRPSLRRSAAKGARPRRVYDTTRAEDLGLAALLAGVFFAVRGAYDVVPMLFAMGIAGCAAFLAWKSWRVIVDRDARFSVWQLKRRGRVTASGLAFLALSAMGLTLAGHTGYVNFHRGRGDAIYERLQMPASRVLAGDAPSMSDAMQAEARRALGHYRRACGWRDGGFGLATPGSIDLRSALLHLGIGEAAEAQRLLERRLARGGGGDHLVTDLGRVMLLQGNAEAAASLYGRWLAERPEFWRVREQQSLLMLQRGEVRSAIEEAERALASLPPERFTKTAHARSRLTLARLLLTEGRGEEALAHVVEGTRILPDEALMHENLAAIVLTVRGDIEIALAAMRRAVALEPGDVERRLRLADLLLRAGRADESVVEFEEALRREPEHASRREEVARVLESAGLRDAATRIRGAATRTTNSER